MPYEYGGSNPCCPDDLGYVIKKLGELLEEYKKLNDVYNEVLNQITLIINDLVEQGKIKLDAKYNSDSKTLSFVFGISDEISEDVLEGIINGVTR